MKTFPIDYIGHLVSRGNDEQTQLFSTSGKLPVDFFKTLSAFLNTGGGEILIAYSFKKDIIGLTEEEIDTLRDKITAGINNASNIYPAPRIIIKNVFYHKEKLIYIKVPFSQSAFGMKHGHEVFERRGSVNFLIDNRKDQLWLQERKRFFYPDIKILKYLDTSHFDLEIYQKVIHLIQQNRPAHPWLNLTFEQFMKISGLWIKDPETQESGYTVAAALLFGRDKVISAIFPSFRIDVLREKDGYEGYYDRQTITTNLIDAYTILMDFVKKHLPEIFITKDTVQIGVRDLIYKELLVNFLIHQDYSLGLPAKFAITHLDGAFSVNSNRIVLNKNIDTNNYQPVSKNPLIGKFFRELGLAEELGFGLRKIAAFVSQFSNERPQFHDGSIFFASLPPLSQPTSQITHVEGDFQHNYSNDNTTIETLDILKKFFEKNLVENIKQNPLKGAKN